MGYRRKGKQEFTKARSWDQWLLAWESDLVECGFSRVVLKDEDRWWDFLQHGYLDHHEDEASFSVAEIPPHRAVRAVRLLESILPREEWNSAIALLHLRGIAGE